MDPRDVNRINYNNYFIGQNLDFLVRSKMRSESISTPLKNTPPFYDDVISSKMSLLGKRGFYDPGYIYGFPEENPNFINKQNSDYNQNEINPYDEVINEDYSNVPLENEHYEKKVLPQENQKQAQYERSNNKSYKIQNYLNEKDLNNMNNNYRNANRNKLNPSNKLKDEMVYKERIEMLNKRQTPQKLDDFQLEGIFKNRQNNFEHKQNYIEYNRKDNINLNNNFNTPKEYNEQINRNNNGMIRNKDKIPNKDYNKDIDDYNCIDELQVQKKVGDFVLPLTKNQILQGVLISNFNKRHFYQ